MSQDTLLIELGTAELPPKSLKKLSEAFTAELLSGLGEAQLIDQPTAEAAVAYASPRRMALSVPNTLAAQPDQNIERRGPAIQAAFKDDGEATPAATGFAKSCGVAVADLQRLKTDKGEWLSYSVHQVGKPITELLPAIIDQAIKRLPIPKRMRWGSGSAEFVRPVRWLIVMHGKQVLPAEVLGVTSANLSMGHRFHSDGEILIKHADDYAQTLLTEGHVVANFAERQAMIVDQIQTLAKSVEANIEDDQALLDEVTGLVEYPTALLGSFDTDFLQVPQECLISSMRDHQKYFHLVSDDGSLLPHFITVSNIESKDPQRVQQGNERVLRARLSDARFFWLTDQKTTLEQRVEKLDSVLFHAKLGSVLDKTKRLQSLSAIIARQVGADAKIVVRGALLCKADLVSGMVSEFDELQGVMGHYYADREGEPALVGECIEQHYWPKYAGDALPQTAEAQALALADKIDSLVGIYAAGEVPSGDKDPYGLRRAALSILRILIDKQHAIGLSELVAASAEVITTQKDLGLDQTLQVKIVDYIRSRLTAYYQSQGVPTATINAVMACKPDSPLDFERRVKAVQAFSELSESQELAAANKRISNILKKQKSAISTTVDESLLSETAEQQLSKSIEAIEADCNQLFDQGNYDDGLKKLATLRTPVDNFFEHVMVMSDEPKLQANRLSLLNKLHSLFLRVADISLLQTG